VDLPLPSMPSNVIKVPATEFPCNFVNFRFVRESLNECVGWSESGEFNSSFSHSDVKKKRSTKLHKLTRKQFLVLCPVSLSGSFHLSLGRPGGS
jgi:hypothetical protein